MVKSTFNQRISLYNKYKLEEKMKQKIFTIILILVMMTGLLSNCLIFAENSIPLSIESPQNFTVRIGEQQINLRWKVPQSILNLIENSDGGDSIVYAIDWKQDNGAWNFDNKVPSNPCYTDDYFEPFGVFFGYQGNSLSDDNNTSETFLVAWHLYPKDDTNAVFDFKNSTYYFRMRFLFEYTGEDGEAKYISSPYTEVVSLGKNASNTTVTKLDAPQNLKVSVKKDSNGKPYFSLNWIIPDSIKEANKSLPVYHKIDFKIGNGKWYSETNGISELPIAPSSLLSATDDFDPVEKEFVKEVVIEANTYHFRILFEAETSTDTFVRSAFSNEFSIGVEKYSNASSWAVPEINKASELGLIPDILKGADMTKPITREEFAELAVLLYEKTTGKIAEAAANPFTDTANSQILKAFKLGITTGTSATTFTPKKLISREQCAAMLFRALKAITPDGDFSIVGVKDFPDQKNIENYAVEATKYMSKIGIIKGNDQGEFMPKATTTAQEVKGFGMATREAAILMTVRAYENMK